MRPNAPALSSLQVRTLVARSMNVPELAGDDLDLRRRLVDLVEAELLTDLPIDLDPGRPAHEFFAQLVDACRRRWGGMHALSDAVHAVSAQCQAREDLRGLLRGMAGQGLIVDAERRELQRILARHQIELTAEQIGDLVCGIRASRSGSRARWTSHSATSTAPNRTGCRRS